MVIGREHEENFNTKIQVEPNSYSLTGKIMLGAIIILFCVVVLMVCLHLYARWYLLRARRRRLRRSHQHNRRSTQLVFYVDPTNPGGAQTAMRGLDASVIKTLPVFLYSSKTHPESVECAVCLSEFEENESGRVLPKCNHSFHIECIDMWFHSHSTCPLCRAPVEAVDQTRTEVVITVCEPERPEAGSSSGLCSDCHLEENRTGDGVCSSSSSIEFRRKPSAIEIPKRNESFGRGDETVGCGSPSTPSPFRSPMSRMLSFKRILSRERKGNLSPSGSGGVCSSTSELDSERVGREETQ